MITITINDITFQAHSYSRNTHFSQDQITSEGQFEIINGAEMIPTLRSLVNQNITSLIIKNDNEVIYDAGLIFANVTDINEILNDTAVDVDVHLKFHEIN